MLKTQLTAPPVPASPAVSAAPAASPASAVPPRDLPIRTALDGLIRRTSRLNFPGDTSSDAPGDIPGAIREDMELRKLWRALLDEAESLWTRRPPFTLIYRNSPAKTKIHYGRETADLTFLLELVPNRDSRLPGDIRRALWNSRRMDDWGFRGWPAGASGGVTAQGFPGFRLLTVLRNGGGKPLGQAGAVLKSPFTLSSGRFDKAGPPPVLFLLSARAEAVFREIPAADLEGPLRLEILQVNGSPQEKEGPGPHLAAVSREEYLAALAPFSLPEMVTLDGGASLSRDWISCRSWLSLKLWAEGRGYRFAGPGLENRRPFLGINDSFDFPVTDVSIEDAMVWCNACSEFAGKPPYYVHPDTGAILRDSVSLSAGEPGLSGPAGRGFARDDPGGFRLPFREELALALRDGFPDLQSFDSGAWFFPQDAPNEALVVPSKNLGLTGLTKFSREFITPPPGEKTAGEAHPVFFFNRLDPDTFRIACSSGGGFGVSRKE